MRNKLLAVFLVAASVPGCASGVTTPPIDVPLPDQSVKLSDIWPASAGGPSQAQQVPLVPQLPPTDILKNIPGLSTISYLPVPLLLPAGVPVAMPDQAKKVPISKATLKFTAINNNSIPFTVRTFLAKENPYTSDPNPTILDMPAGPGGTATGSHDLDPQWFKESQIHVGFGLSTKGTNGQPASVDPNAAIVLKSTLTVQFSLTSALGSLFGSH